MFKKLGLKGMINCINVLLTFFIWTPFSLADIQYYRWGQSPNLTDNLNVILKKLNLESGLNLAATDFILVEERDLANSQFKTFAQVQDDVAIEGALIRTWVSPDTSTIIQMEAHLDDSSLLKARRNTLAINKLAKGTLKPRLSTMNNMDYIYQVVSAHSSDKRIGKIKFQDKWRGADLIRVIDVTGRRGTHKITVSHFTKKIISSTYREFPQADIQALAYPIYEESEKNKIRQQLVPVILKNLFDTRRLTHEDPYLPLQKNHYYEDMMNPILGETPEGRAQGYWSPNWLLRAARELYNALPIVDNNFTSGGLFLEGQYASINIHPDAISRFKGINFSPSYSSQLAVLWKMSPISGPERWEIVPSGAFYGRPLLSAQEALSRQARRLPDHDAVSYLNDGFDEIQVYYAIDRLMESLHGMGFSDPDLSTRPFHAFLYDPDISMRDNAYYTNDTINFTTYSPDGLNYARDNSTIWHELGHGIMDRLMGDMIELADTGGLSEGMADFIAQLVIQDVTSGIAFDGSQDFRIINRTGFSLTNESHDDGEAYGGAMNDMLTAAIDKFGRIGVVKISDLTLEAMRLSRNHPELTANDWFEHMMYADELGRPGLRAPNEMHDLIISALNTRNFRLDRGKIAKFNVKNGMSELTDSSPGSRYKPISHSLGKGQTAQHELDISLSSSEFYEFKYPVNIEVQLNGGPLQGAVKWENESLAPFRYTINSPNEKIKIKLAALPGCDFINREDGTCSDFAYLQVYNNGEMRPVAKKRFYLRITDGSGKKGF